MPEYTTKVKRTKTYEWNLPNYEMETRNKCIGNNKQPFIPKPHFISEWNESWINEKPPPDLEVKLGKMTSTSMQGTSGRKGNISVRVFSPKLRFLVTKPCVNNPLHKYGKPGPSWWWFKTCANQRWTHPYPCFRWLEHDEPNIKPWHSNP